MAKREMMCPFSDRLCRNCAVYIGRHYYRCFFENYRGYVYQPKEDDAAGASPANDTYPEGDFKIPAVTSKVLDPFAVTL